MITRVHSYYGYITVGRKAISFFASYFYKENRSLIINLNLNDVNNPDITITEPFTYYNNFQDIRNKLENYLRAQNIITAEDRLELKPFVEVYEIEKDDKKCYVHKISESYSIVMYPVEGSPLYHSANEDYNKSFQEIADRYL